MMKTREVSTRNVNSGCQGFSLIEALVALLVLALGLLAVGGMQLKALQGAHMGYQRSLASVIAIDAQERIWSKLRRTSGQLICPNANEVLADWKKAWFDNGGDGRETLPGGASSKITGECTYKVIVDWSEERFAVDEEAEGEDVSKFTYFFMVPGEPLSGTK